MSCSFVNAALIGNIFGLEALSLYVFISTALNIFSNWSLFGAEISLNQSFARRTLSQRQINLARTLAASASVIAFLYFILLSTLSTVQIILITLSTLLTAQTYVLANVIKFESISIFEFLRSGAHHPVYLAGIAILIAFEVKLTGTHLAATFFASSFLIYAVSTLCYAKITKRIQLTPQNREHKSSFFKSTLFSSPVMLTSSILVAGELIVAKGLLNVDDFDKLALLSRISFAYAIIFSVINNRISATVAKDLINIQSVSEYLAACLKKNFLVAAIFIIPMYWQHEFYLSLFSGEAGYGDVHHLVFLILIAHGINIISAGIIPLLSVVSKPTLDGIAVALLAVMVLIYALALSHGVIVSLERFCLFFYGSLGLFKTALISFSLFLCRGKACDSF